MTTLYNTKVDLSGLLEVLGKNLYSTPSVAIRELIQNAHDACRRLQLESHIEAEPQIVVECRPNPPQLIIRDTGSGLTHSEIEQFLATIGSGYTRLLRTQSASEDMIGYFGLGFLSAYVVADKVEVVTTSYQTPEQSWLFSSNGGHRFTISETPTTTVGSEVRLLLKNDYRDLANSHVIEQLLNKYCCLLPIAIYLNQQSQPINQQQAPWLQAASPLQTRKQQMAFAHIFEDRFAPLCTLPIQDNDLSVNGFLWLQDSGAYASSDYRNVNVFVRNMFISSDTADLLPKWAGFVGCVINTPTLTPTASREDIQKDAQYDAVQELLLESLIVGLQNLAQQQPENWRRVLRRHNQSLLAAALCDERLFDELQDQVKIPTSMGDMTVKTLRQKSHECFYIQADDQNHSQDILLRAQMIPVISGYLYAVSAFCRKYTDAHPTLRCLFLGEQKDNTTLFSPTAVDDQQRQWLTSLFGKDNEELIFTRFAPHYIPLVRMENQEAKLKQKIEGDQADQQIGSAILALARNYTQTIADSPPFRLYLNLDSPFFDSLACLPTAKQQLAAELLHNYMSTLNKQTDSRDDASNIEAFFGNLSALMAV